MSCLFNFLLRIGAASFFKNIFKVNYVQSRTLTVNFLKSNYNTILVMPLFSLGFSHVQNICFLGTGCICINSGNSWRKYRDQRKKVSRSKVRASRN